MKLKLCIIFQTAPKFRKCEVIWRKFGFLSGRFGPRFLPHTGTKMCMLLSRNNFGFHSLAERSRRTQHDWFVKKPKHPASQNVVSHSKLLDILQNCQSVSDQISAFDSCVKLEEEDVAQRLNVCRQLEDLLRRYFPSCSVNLVGSSANGFGIKGCDVDLSFQFADAATVEKLEDSTLWTNSLDEILDMEVVPLNKVLRLTPRNQLFLVQKALQRSGLREPFTLLRGRVPILNFYLDNLACDLSISNKSAVDSTRLMLLCAKLDSRVAPLVRITNYWAKQNNLIGGPLKFKSYALFLLVVFFLQSRKPPILPTIEQMLDKTDFHSTAQNNSQDVLKYLEFFEESENCCTVEQLLEEFFCFYGNFDFSLVICPRTMELLERRHFLSRKNGQPGMELNAVSIQDPLNSQWNVTTGVNFKYCKHFLKSILSVCETFGESEPWGLSSVLGVLDLTEGAPQTGNTRMSFRTSSFLQRPPVDDAGPTFQKIGGVLKTIFEDCLRFESIHLDRETAKCVDASGVSAEKHFVEHLHYVTGDTWSGRSSWQLKVDGENPVVVEREVSRMVRENARAKDREPISFTCECRGVHRDDDLWITISLQPIHSEKFVSKFGIFLRQYLRRMFKVLL